MLKRLMGRYNRPTTVPAVTEQILDAFLRKPMQDQLADLVYLIVTHNIAAGRVVEHMHAHIQDWDVKTVRVGFDVYQDAEYRDRCECWFELEYCDYIHDQLVDEAMLKRTCENIRRGTCIHVSESDKSGEKVLSYIGLMHVAAGSGNKDIVRLLYKLGSNEVYFRSSCGLWPLYISLAKSCTSVTDVLFDIQRRCLGYWYVDSLRSSDMMLAIRDSISGRVVKCSFWLCPDIICFVRMAGDVSEEVIKKMLPIIRRCMTICDLAKSLLNVNQGRLAYRYLRVSKTKCTECVWSLMVCSVLVDDRYFLKNVHARGMLYGEHRLKELGYNLLDIAHAFGSTNCLNMLEKSTHRTDGLYQRISPFTFLINFVAASNGMDPYVMAGLFLKLHAQGHNVNQQDENGLTPLLYAIELVRYHPAFILELLAIGADVDAKDRNGRTPLYSVLTPYNSPLRSNRSYGKRGTLKDILMYNPKVKCSFNQSAVHYAAHEDLHGCSKLKYLDEEWVIKFKARETEKQDEDIEAKTFKEKIIAVSNVALLYELGFKITSQKLQTIGPRNHLQVLTDYLSEMECEPRTLQSLCRLTIRNAYPGRQLHTMMRSVCVPKKIFDYVVRPYFLKYVEVVRINYKGVEETTLIDM